MKRRTIHYLFLFLLIIGSTFGFCFTSTLGALQAAEPDAIAESMGKLETLYRYIDALFLFDIDEDEIYESMARALFSALDDPYSQYITAEESQDIRDLTQGVYGGIGAYISKPNPEYRDPEDPETYMVTIVAPFAGSPAYRAGLHAGDLISHIDGQLVDELTVEESSARLRGPSETDVILTIHRGSLVFDVTVTRAIVEIPTIRSDLIDRTGYIHILEFTPVTSDTFKQVIGGFTASGYDSLIIDLRGNPGGAVDAALQIADYLLSDETMLIMESKLPGSSLEYRAERQTLIPSNTPVAVLIDGGTASSSEILAGALKDNDRAILLGSTSFGKGLVQNVYPFGDDYFKITAARYLTPDRQDIHEIGIIPDIEISEPELSEEELEHYRTLIETHRIEDYVKGQPIQDPAADQAFIQELQEEGITLPERYLQRLIRSEYEYLMDFPPVYDLDYDLVLQEALKVLKEGNTP